MSFSIGIIGLPNAGKSTLFKALTKQPVNIADYPFTTIEPNVGIVAVPDKRLQKLAKFIKPEKKVNTIIKFIDIAGLVKNAHKGEGLGNQFLAQIREADAILHVAKAYEKKADKQTDALSPAEDIKTVDTELMLKDLEFVENHARKIKKESQGNEKEKKKKIELLELLKTGLNKGKPAREINSSLQEIKEELGLLTDKPAIHVYNISEGIKCPINKNIICLNLKIEEELIDLSNEEKKELDIRSNLDEIIRHCYNKLDLITFYTIKGGKEVRARTIEKNSKATEAAEKIHTDFKKKFIKAEVIGYDKFIQAGSWHSARDKGWLRLEGKDYIVRDGDILEIKI